MCVQAGFDEELLAVVGIVEATVRGGVLLRRRRAPCEDVDDLEQAEGAKMTRESVPLLRLVLLFLLLTSSLRHR